MQPQPIDTDAIRANYCGGQKRANWQAYIFGDVGLLCDEVDRLRAENVEKDRLIDKLRAACARYEAALQRREADRG